MCKPREVQSLGLFKSTITGKKRKNKENYNVHICSMELFQVFYGFRERDNLAKDWKLNSETFKLKLSHKFLRVRPTKLPESGVFVFSHLQACRPFWNVQ